MPESIPQAQVEVDDVRSLRAQAARLEDMLAAINRRLESLEQAQSNEG